jgi:hypothetical protein
MRTALDAGGYQFSSMVECVVTSRQFLEKRGGGQLIREYSLRE